MRFVEVKQAEQIDLQALSDKIAAMVKGNEIAQPVELMGGKQSIQRSCPPSSMS